MIGSEVLATMAPGQISNPIVSSSFFNLCLAASISDRHYSTIAVQHIATDPQQHFFATIEKC